MKKTICLSIASIFLFTACAENEPTPPPKANLVKESTSVQNKVSTQTPAPKRRIAPKRSVRKFKKITKDDIKYKDTSESSKVRLYDPKTKSKITVKEENNPTPKTKGGKIFQERGCVLCHKPKVTRLGPSLKLMTKHYKNKKSTLIKYLQRKGKPIIHPERGSIMKTQLAKITILSPEDIDLLGSYIISHEK